MKKFLFSIFFIIISFYGFSQEIVPADTIPQDTVVTKYVVGIKQSPPFIIKNGEDYSGLSIELWEHIAQDLKIVYEYKEYSQQEFSQMLSDVETSKLDICINPLTVTSDRLNRFEYTLPFFSSNMVLVVPKEGRVPIFKYLQNIFSLRVVNLIIILFSIVLVSGFIVWLAERKKNSQFRKNYKGILDGIWWTSVTMTTVGYGDKVPISKLGRVVAMVWMFSSIIIISSITGSIAAALTVKSISEKIETIEDVRKLQVGTMKASSSEEFLKKHHFHNIQTYFESIEQALQAVANGEIEAFVYDEAIVSNIINRNNLHNKVEISSYKLNAIYYSFSLPKSTQKLQEINITMVNNLEAVSWVGILNKYDLSN